MQIQEALETSRISVVICVRNRASILERSLTAIRAAEPHEVVIVDGNSTDGTLEIAKRMADIVVSDGGKGLSAARQIGAEVATGDYVAYVDSDVVVKPDTLRSLAALLDSDTGIGAAHACIRSGDTDTYWSACTQTRMDLLNEYTPGEKSTLGCMAVVIRRELILKHPFDPYFVGASEDEDFYYRLRRDGWKLVAGDAVAYHHHRESFRECVKQRVWYGRGSVRLALKGYPKAKVGLLVHPAKLLGVVLAARAIRNGQAKILPYIVVQSSAHYAGELIEAASLLSKAALRQPLPKPRESLKRSRI